MASQHVALILYIILIFSGQTYLDLYLYMVHIIVNVLPCISIAKTILVESAENVSVFSVPDLLYSRFLCAYVTKPGQLIYCDPFYQMSGGCRILCGVWGNFILLWFIILKFYKLKILPWQKLNYCLWISEVFKIAKNEGRYLHG